MTDVVGRARAASDKIREVFAGCNELFPLRLALAIEDLDAVVPDLVSEVEALRTELAWLTDTNKSDSSPCPNTST